MKKFDNKIVIITGGGRGIGRELAFAFAEEGAKLVICSRTRNELEEVVNIIKQNDEEAIYSICDIQNHQDILELVNKTISTYGIPDILINCAGLLSIEPAEDIEMSTWNKVIGINLTGTFDVCKEVAKIMFKKRKGKIVNFASLLSFVAFPQRAAYAASKAGLMQLTKVLGVEWIKMGINVNAIVPGMIQAQKQSTHPLQCQEDFDFSSFLKRIPMGQLGKVRDVIGTVFFLASNESDYMVGQYIVVDGGWLSYGYL